MGAGILVMKAWQQLHQVAYLKDLDVSMSCITDSGVSCLSSDGHMNLQVLSLSGCSRVSNESVFSFEKLGIKSPRL